MAYTEVHCDASIDGFGAVLLQRQTKKMQAHNGNRIEIPQFRAGDACYRICSKTFPNILLGIPFVIISNCSVVTQTLKKRDINALIARWSLELQNFDFKVQHRRGTMGMRHVNALSRPFGVLVIDDNPFKNLPCYKVTIRKLKNRLLIWKSQKIINMNYVTD